MIFFANAEGTITKIITEPLYQGSVLASRVVLVAPFPNAMVTVAFELPNGVNTDVDLATPNMVQQDLQGIITPTGQKYNAWTYLLPSSITEYAGVVSVQFFITTGVSGQILATSPITLTVQKGVPEELPSTPTPNIYEQILEYLTRVEEKLNSVIIPVNVLPTDQTLINFNAIYLLNTNGVYNFYVYYTTISAWVQIDKAVATVATAEEIKDNSKVYILTVDNGGLDAGVYVINEGAPLRLLSTVDLAKINIKLQLLELLIDTKETTLKQQIQGVQNTANNAVSTANSANMQSQNAVGISNQAQGTANEAVTVANSANAKSTTAVNTSDEAKRIAQEALDKAGSATGGLTPKGNISSISDLPTPSAETLGWFYNVNNAFTTTDQFVEGAGISYLAGENVAIVEPEPGVYKYDVFSGLVDLSPLENEITRIDEKLEDLENASNVVANPTDTPTEQLNNIKIDDVTYKIGEQFKTRLTTIFQTTPTPFSAEDIAVFYNVLATSNLTLVSQVVFNVRGEEGIDYVAFLQNAYTDYETNTINLVYKNPIYALHLTYNANTQEFSGYFGASQDIVETVDVALTTVFTETPQLLSMAEIQTIAGGLSNILSVKNISFLVVGEESDVKTAFLQNVRFTGNYKIELTYLSSYYTLKLNGDLSTGAITGYVILNASNSQVSLNMITFTDRPTLFTWLQSNWQKVIKGSVTSGIGSSAISVVTLDTATSSYIMCLVDTQSSEAGTSVVLTSYKVTNSTTILSTNNAVLVYNDNSLEGAYNAPTELPDAGWTVYNVAVTLYYLE